MRFAQSLVAFFFFTIATATVVSAAPQLTGIKEEMSVNRRDTAEDNDLTISMRRDTAEDNDLTISMRRDTAEDNDLTISMRRDTAEHNGN